MQPPIVIGGQSVAAGTRETIRLPYPNFYTCSPAAMPVQVIRGRQAGPTLLITSSLHGDEINGVEIIRRLKGHKSINRLKGTLLLIPVVNVFGFVGQSRYLPDRRDLNRSFPGSSSGSMAARLAHLMMSEIFPHCTQAIDLHTAAVGRDNLPQIRASLNGNETLRDMAKAFNTPVVLDAGLRDGTFRQAAHKADVPTLVYEAGEALRFDEFSIRAGVAGIINVMAHLGMIRRRPARRTHEPLIARSSQWIRAPQSGVARSLVALGQEVSEGDIMAYISDPFGEQESAVECTASGIVIGRSRIPLVHEGEAVFHIARFAQTAHVAESIESFQDAFDPESSTVETEEPPLIG